MKILTKIIALSHIFVFAHSASANTSGREFVMSCTYGVLAGTLVGAASLAFEDQPGDNLNKVARGASLGLYAGILLGVYVVYVVPGSDQPEIIEEPPLLPPLEEASWKRIRIYPMISKNGIDGVGAHWNVFSF